MICGRVPLYARKDAALAHRSVAEIVMHGGDKWCVFPRDVDPGGFLLAVCSKSLTVIMSCEINNDSTASSDTFVYNSLLNPYAFVLSFLIKPISDVFRGCLKSAFAFTQRITRKSSLTVEFFISDESTKRYPTHGMKSSLMRCLQLSSISCSLSYKVLMMYSATSPRIGSAPLPIAHRRLYWRCCLISSHSGLEPPSCDRLSCTALCRLRFFSKSPNQYGIVSMATSGCVGMFGRYIQAHAKDKAFGRTSRRYSDACSPSTVPNIPFPLLSLVGKNDESRPRRSSAVISSVCVCLYTLSKNAHNMTSALNGGGKCSSISGTISSIMQFYFAMALAETDLTSTKM